MGYNAHLMKVGIIPTKKGAAGTAVAYAIAPALDQRVTIASLRCRAGAAGGNLEVFQSEALYSFSLLTDGAVITVPGIPAGLSGRNVVIRFPTGETKATVITEQTGEALTLATSLTAEPKATLYLMGETTSNSTFVIPLTVSETTVLQADCPGVIVGKELGWPVLLYMENTDGNCSIEGGTVAFIGV